ncbi:SRPBCC family protein [Formosa haliotis]|uniref:SRPBCC family protein n=1 Tax=Formosa haliotis TaxID=1555194 RepID=UPI00082417E3|nr:SRPBCC domain-containing protein [Formosa haliotis]
MDTINWTSFTKRIFIKASIEQLFWCWTTEDGITSWFLKSAEFLREDLKLPPATTIVKGDRYIWKWFNWDGKETGNILAIENNKTIHFSFAGKTEVKVTLEQHDLAVLVTLTQFNIAKDEKSKHDIYYGCSNGWTFWLTNLKAYLEHNILLNETEVDVSPFQLAGYEFVNM